MLIWYLIYAHSGLGDVGIIDVHLHRSVMMSPQDDDEVFDDIDHLDGDDNFSSGYSTSRLQRFQDVRCELRSTGGHNLVRKTLIILAYINYFHFIVNRRISFTSSSTKISFVNGLHVILNITDFSPYESARFSARGSLRRFLPRTGFSSRPDPIQ